MSSQTNKGIPFLHGFDGIGYKLLELPPELVTLLEGENPPILKLKASPHAAMVEAGGKTYSLRQKNTSNALIIMQPFDEVAHNVNQLQTAPADTGMRAIASVHETVELLPENGPVPTAAKTKGKWHEKFGRSR